MRRRNDPTAVTQAPPPLPHDAAKVVESVARSVDQVFKDAAKAMEDRSSIAKPATDPGFVMTSLPGFEPPKMPPSFERIVTTVFDVPEPDKEFARLRLELEMTQIKPSRADYGTIVDSLDQAEKNAQAAVELVANFELAYEAFCIDELAMSGAYRERAKAELDKQRQEEFLKSKEAMGSKASAGKQITEADVAAAVASMFPDEARILAERRAQAKGARDSVRSLAERWAERAKDLRAMVSTTRAAATAHY